MATKTYVAKGKTVGQYGMVKIGLKYADLKQHVNDRGYLNLVVGPLKEADKYGNTHTVWVDDWKPESKTQKPADVDDGMPF